jgi:hypothetical protein
MVPCFQDGNVPIVPRSLWLCSDQCSDKHGIKWIIDEWTFAIMLPNASSWIAGKDRGIELLGAEKLQTRMELKRAGFFRYLIISWITCRSETWAMAKEPKASVTESVLGEMQYEGMNRPRIPSIKTTRMHLPHSVEMPTVCSYRKPTFLIVAPLLQASHSAELPAPHTSESPTKQSKAKPNESRSLAQARR